MENSGLTFKKIHMYSNCPSEILALISPISVTISVTSPIRKDDSYGPKNLVTPIFSSNLKHNVNGQVKRDQGRPRKRERYVFEMYRNGELNLDRASKKVKNLVVLEESRE
ncbi:MAG: hypothetical protein WBG50_03990 [Desulfomonilaceae bacterium]